jgi:Fe2+ transport system protein FeoA
LVKIDRMNALDLWSLQENQEALVKAFCPALPFPHRERFIELGFREGEAVKCVKSTPFGAPRVFEVCDTVFSVSKEDAKRIFVALDP